MATKNNYPATFDIKYSEKSERLTSFFRVLWAIPAVIILTVLSGSGGPSFMEESSKNIAASGGDIMGALSVATALMIVFRQRYPRWWFDFALELNRFSARVAAYLFLLTDKYPSTVEKQDVKLDIDYPDVKNDLNKWLPLFKWLLAIPHYFVLVVLILAAMVATVIAWFAILFTGRYPKPLFDFVVAVGAWNVRVTAYAFMLTTDKYPPFSLK